MGLVKADRAKLHDDFDLFGNARSSELSNVTSGARSENNLRTISICDNGVRCETHLRLIQEWLRPVIDRNSKNY